MSLRLYLTLGFLLGALEVANIFWASLALLQVLVLFRLTSQPASSPTRQGDGR